MKNKHMRHIALLAILLEFVDEVSQWSDRWYVDFKSSSGRDSDKLELNDDYDSYECNSMAEIRSALLNIQKEWREAYREIRTEEEDVYEHREQRKNIKATLEAVKRMLKTIR